MRVLIRVDVLAITTAAIPVRASRKRAREAFDDERISIGAF